MRASWWSGDCVFTVSAVEWWLYDLKYSLTQIPAAVCVCFCHLWHVSGKRSSVAVSSASKTLLCYPIFSDVKQDRTPEGEKISLIRGKAGLSVGRRLLVSEPGSILSLVLGTVENRSGWRASHPRWVSKCPKCFPHFDRSLPFFFKHF